MAKLRNVAGRRDDENFDPGGGVHVGQNSPITPGANTTVAPPAGPPEISDPTAGAGGAGTDSKSSQTPRERAGQTGATPPRPVTPSPVAGGPQGPGSSAAPPPMAGVPFSPLGSGGSVKLRNPMFGGRHGGLMEGGLGVQQGGGIGDNPLTELLKVLLQGQ